MPMVRVSNGGTLTIDKIEVSAQNHLANSFYNGISTITIDTTKYKYVRFGEIYKPSGATSNFRMFINGSSSSYVDISSNGQVIDLSDISSVRIYLVIANGPLAQTSYTGYISDIYFYN